MGYRQDARRWEGEFEALAYLEAVSLVQLQLQPYARVSFLVLKCAQITVIMRMVDTALVYRYMSPHCFPTLAAYRSVCVHSGVRLFGLNETTTIPCLIRPHPPHPHQARTIEASNKAYEARDAAQHEMAGLKAQARRDPGHHADHADHADDPPAHHVSTRLSLQPWCHTAATVHPRAGGA